MLRNINMSYYCLSSVLDLITQGALFSIQRFCGNLNKQSQKDFFKSRQFTCFLAI